MNLGAQWSDIREAVLADIDEILCSGQYLEHPVVEELEGRLASYLGVRGCVCVNSGTDALMLVLHALNIGHGDEVITVPNSFIASVAAIEHVGASTRLVDVGPDHLLDVNLVEQAITRRTKAILPVHLEGKMCDMKALDKICEKHGLFLIEDAAQAIGSWRDSMGPGARGSAACFSLHPLKNLNACGDSGFVASNDLELLSRVRATRNHGQVERNLSNDFGVVSRMDSLQAAVVLRRLEQLTNVISRRREHATLYSELLGQSPKVLLPVVDESSFHSYHLFVVEVPERDPLQSTLTELGIETRVHYPRLISQQQAFIRRYGRLEHETPECVRQSGRILSLPIHQHLSDEQIKYVATSIVSTLDALT